MRISRTASPEARDRLRQMVKRMVIEHAYLENLIESGTDDATIRLAENYLNDAIDHLNEYLDAEHVPMPSSKGIWIA